MSERQPQQNNLVLIASSNPEKVRDILDRMNEASIKRAEREGKEREVPSNIQASRLNIIKRSRIFTFTYHGQEHSIEKKGNLKSFEGWITEYSKTAQLCITCDKLMLPGEAVGECNEGLMHLTYYCCPSASYFAGHIDEKGQLKQYKKK